MTMTVTLPSDHHHSYHTRPWLFTHEHHTWVCSSSLTLITQMIHYSWPSWLITIIYDHDSWLSSMTSLTYEYQDCHLYPPLMTIMTYDYHLSHIDLSPMTMLLIHDLSHVTRDYVFLHWPMTITYHLWLMTYGIWLWSMTIIYHL